MSLKTSAGVQDSGTEAESDAKNIEADLGLAELIEQHENTGWSGAGLRWIFPHVEVGTGLDPDDARDLAAFRHDAHKFTGESHGEAREEFAGVPMNQSVPEGADGDAAALSRPQQKQKQTVPTHDDYSRLSLLTGETAYDPGKFSRATIKSEFRDLLAVEQAKTAHEQ